MNEFNTIENWPCVLLTCPIRCTVFNSLDSLMFARFSLGEFRETPLSQKIKVTKYTVNPLYLANLAFWT